jgi:hypothetical protein
MPGRVGSRRGGGGGGGFGERAQITMHRLCGTTPRHFNTPQHNTVSASVRHEPKHRYAAPRVALRCVAPYFRMKHAGVAL